MITSGRIAPAGIAFRWIHSYQATIAYACFVWMNAAGIATNGASD
jgi:hypothetical protein